MARNPATAGSVSARQYVVPTKVPVRGPGGFLDLRPSDCPVCRLPLGLHVNTIQSQRVLTDHAVHALIA